MNRFPVLCSQEQLVPFRLNILLWDTNNFPFLLIYDIISSVCSTHWGWAAGLLLLQHGLRSFWLSVLLLLSSTNVETSIDIITEFAGCCYFSALMDTKIYNVCLWNPIYKQQSSGSEQWALRFISACQPSLFFIIDIYFPLTHKSIQPELWSPTANTI